jgi:hypothetical protein
MRRFSFRSRVARSASFQNWGSALWASNCSIVSDSRSGSKMPPELGEPFPVRKESVPDFLDVDMIAVHEEVLSSI